MAPTARSSKKQQAPRKKPTVQLKRASGSKVSKPKMTANPADVKAKSVQKTRPSRRNDTEQETEASASDNISKRTRRGDKKLAEIPSVLKKDDENVADVARSTRRRGKDVEQAQPVAAKKEKVVGVRDVNSNNSTAEQKGKDSGKDVPRKRRAKVAEEMPVDQTVKEKVLRSARAATKGITEMKKNKVAEKEKDNTKRLATLRSGNRQTKKDEKTSQRSKKQDKLTVEEVNKAEMSGARSKTERKKVVATVSTRPRKGRNEEVIDTPSHKAEKSGARSKTERKKVVATVSARPRKRRNEATNEEVIDTPSDDAVKTDQIVQKKRKAQRAKRASVVHGKAPVGDQIEHSLKKAESVVANDDVKTSAKKIVRRQTRKKEDAQPISVQDAVSEKQVDDPLTANSDLEGNAKKSPMESAVELQTRTKEDGLPVAEQDAAAEEQVEESMMSDVGLESSAEESATRNAIESRTAAKEGTPPIAEQDAAFKMECKEGIPEEVLNDEPVVEGAIDEHSGTHDDVDIRIPSDNNKAEHGSAIKTPSNEAILVSPQLHDDDVDHSTSFRLGDEGLHGAAASAGIEATPIQLDRSHIYDVKRTPFASDQGDEGVHEAAASAGIEATPIQLDRSHSDDVKRTPFASDQVVTVHDESRSKETFETDQASIDDEVVFMESIPQREQFIDVTTSSPTEAMADDGNVSQKDESVNSLDLAERNRRLAATQLCELRMRELEEGDMTDEIDVCDNLTGEASGAEDVVLLHSRHAGDDECFEEPNIASPEAVERPDELIERNSMQPMQFDEVLNEETGSIIVEKEKVDETEVDRDLSVESSHSASYGDCSAVPTKLCFDINSPDSEERVGTSQRNSSPFMCSTDGLRVTQDVRERLMGEVRSRMTNFMSGKGNEQHPDDGHNEPDLEGHIVNERWICDEEDDIHVTDNIDDVVVEDKDADNSFRAQETEKARIDSDVAETAFEKKETIDGQETLNLEQSVEGSREDLLMREEESNKERLQEKEKSSEKSAVDVGEKHQLSVDTKEDDSDIDVETVQEIVPQKVTVEKNRETSSDYLRASEKVTSQEVSIQQGIAEETRSTHFRSSIQAHFAAQHKKFWEQGPNLQEQAERIKQRYLKHQSQVPLVFQRLSKNKDNSGTCVQSDKKARIQRFDSATLAKASTSSTSFTSSGSDADEVAKPRPEGQFGVPPSYRGFSLGASMSRPTHLPRLKMSVKTITKQVAEEKRHSTIYATRRSESGFSKTLQRFTTPRAVALRDSDDKPTSSGSVSYTPHKRIPTSVHTTEMSQRQFGETVKSDTVKPITGIPPFRETLREETKPKLNET
uniref:Microtubule-associated protein futsch n=1 Tax=Parascaris univalens TaxID=6257 RepID=A0A915A8T0_PARUN